MSEAVVILAAGMGSRYSGPEGKLRATFRGRPLVSWALDAVASVECDERIVVVGGIEISDLIPEGFTVVKNVNYASGMASSLAAATRRCEESQHGAMTVGLADQPNIAARCWTNVLMSRGSPIAVATYNGRRRNPVRLERSVWVDLPSEGDLGARSLIAAHPEMVAEVACEGECFDIDTVEDLLKWS